MKAVFFVFKSSSHIPFPKAIVQFSDWSSSLPHRIVLFFSVRKSSSLCRSIILRSMPHQVNWIFNAIFPCGSKNETALWSNGLPISVDETDIISGKSCDTFDESFKRLKSPVRWIPRLLNCKPSKEKRPSSFLSFHSYEQDPGAFLMKVTECVNQSKDNLYTPDASNKDDPHAIMYVKSTRTFSH